MVADAAKALTPDSVSIPFGQSDTSQRKERLKDKPDIDVRIPNMA